MSRISVRPRPAVACSWLAVAIPLVLLAPPTATIAAPLAAPLTAADPPPDAAAASSTVGERARALLAEAIALRAQATTGDLRRAIERANEARLLFAAAGDAAGEAEAMIARASCRVDLGEVEAALAELRAALAVAERAGDEGTLALALSRLGGAEQIAGEVAPAAEHLERALAHAVTAGDEAREADARLEIAGLARLRGAAAEGIPHLERAIEIDRRLGRETERGEAEITLAMTYGWLDRTADAIAVYERVLADATRRSDRLQVAACLANLGHATLDLGEPARALAYLEQALPAVEALGTPDPIGSVLLALGTAALQLGDIGRATDAWERSLALFRGMGERYGEAQATIALARVQANFGDAERARSLYQAALDIGDELGEPMTIETALLSLALLEFERGDLAAARATNERALASAEARGHATDQASALANLADVARAAGDPAAALAAAEQAVTLAEPLDDPRTLAFVLKRRGLARLAAADDDQAAAGRADLARALDLYRRAASPIDQAGVLEEIGAADLERGDLASAVAAGHEAIALVESLRARVQGPLLRGGVVAARRAAYELALAAELRLDTRDPRGGHRARAFEVAERGRARLLLDRLMVETAIETAGEMTGAGDGGDEPFERALRDLEGRLRNREQRRFGLLAARDQADERRRLEAEIDDLLAQLEDLERRRRTPDRHSGGGSNTRTGELAEPVGLAEVQALLDDDTALLEIAFGADGSHLFRITRTEVEVVPLPPRAALEAAAARVHALTSARGARVPFETAAARERRIADADRALGGAVGELSRQLFAPLADLAKRAESRWVLVAPGALQRLPWAALVDPGDGSPLLGRREIATLPSASALAALRRRRTASTPAGATIAVLADPVFDAADPRVRRSPATASPARDAAPAPVARAAQEAGLTLRDGGLERLPGSRREAEAILRLAARNGRAALDFSASRETALEPGVRRARIVHFATHALENERHPELSGVVLSLVDEQGAPRDGFLRLREIYGLDLAVDLVVLSACRTALGRAAEAEGEIGLARGFLMAGARQVLATLWDTDDAATAELLGRFYRHLLVARRPPGAALRAAQLEISRLPRYRAPYYWAGFVLTGDWRPAPPRPPA